MRSLVFVFIILGFVGSALATTAQDVKNDTKKAASTAAQYTSEQKAKVQSELESSLNSMKLQISELRAQANTQGASLKAGLNEKIAKLEKKQAELQADLAKMKNSSGRAWDQMKQGMNAALKNLSDSYKKAKAQFN